jgi:hypothetical protein
MLVVNSIANKDAAYPPNHHQLSSPQYYRPPALNDDAVGVCRRPAGSVQYHQELQYSSAHPAPDPDALEPGHLGSMSILRQGEYIYHTFAVVIQLASPVTNLTLDTRNGLFLAVFSQPFLSLS